jgi:lysine-specific demethylase 8/hypoxia-inducible factor 1-alpha inhibitor (HIF hydroxylase)
MAQVDIGATRAAVSVRGAVDRLHQHTGLGRNRHMDLNLWLGAGGHTEPLHFDSHDGTLMQLHGEKRVVLFPPSQTDNLYPFTFFGGGLAPWFSQVYLDKPDFAAYPALHTALTTKLEVTIAQGEVLYIPANWWHEVSSLGSEYVCSLNRFWKVRPVKRRFATPRATAIYFLLKMPIRPLLFVHGGVVWMVKMLTELKQKLPPRRRDYSST